MFYVCFVLVQDLEMFLQPLLYFNIYPNYLLLNIEDVFLQFLIFNQQIFDLFFSLHKLFFEGCLLDLCYFAGIAVRGLYGLCN